MKKTTIITAFLITVLVILILSSCASSSHCSISANDAKYMAKQLSSQKLKQAK